jgi:hypothetical protein
MGGYSSRDFVLAAVINSAGLVSWIWMLPAGGLKKACTRSQPLRRRARSPRAAKSASIRAR